MSKDVAHRAGVNGRCAALLMALLSLKMIATAVANDERAPAKVMMYYGSWDNEEMFDATRWFSDDLYRPRPGFEQHRATMLRARPMPFTQEQIEEFPVIASVALQKYYPDIDSFEIAYAAPDLSKRVRYVYSAFDEPDCPLDYYDLYVELNGTRYVVTFSRDGKTGAVSGHSYWAEAIVGEYAAQAEHREVFEEIEAEERRLGLRH